VIDSPQTDGRWGNTVAGPVFNAIAMESARYLGIVPDNTYMPGTAAKRAAQIPPSLKYAAENKIE
jgi:hypothetical protein